MPLNIIELLTGDKYIYSSPPLFLGPAERIAVKAANLTRRADMEGVLLGPTGGDVNTLLGSTCDQESSDQGQHTGWSS